MLENITGEQYLTVIENYSQPAWIIATDFHHKTI